MTVTIDNEQDQDGSLPLWSKSNVENKYSTRSSIVFGVGAFSKVYLGSNIDKSTKVAVKVVDRSTLDDEEEKQLVAEIAILRELSHENIIAIHDAYCEADNYHIILEYMNGGDLLGILEEENFLDEINARDICYSLMSAVTHLHTHLIAHRDIKPENILVSSSGDDLVIKLADFGFAKKESTPDCLKTLCGTLSYVAPEVLLSRSYGVKCDIWSAGVLAFVLMGGYQPFHSTNDDEIKNLIVEGDFEFDDKYWSHISDAAKDYIESLLIVDPEDRVDAEDLISHSWYSEDLLSIIPSDSSNEKKPVFFMIGSQRSGSNWLRTMLDQREDLVGPHPPHVMREFMPLISKFGDLSQEDNFKILVDHVCTFVERNQVPWNDKYGLPIIFSRKTVYDQAKESCERIKLQEEGDLDNELYLLSIFDALMDFFADANGKELWMCKSMGMSAYHTSLLKFYGEKRLRYIYLVRDPRDVAMSFMNTPVGDKHYYAIVKKWAKLQKQAIAILEDTPELIFNIKYEELLENKEDAISCIYDFIGDRRFGGVKRQASVMSIAPVAASVNQAKLGSESFKAHTLSQQFKNLVRGNSFVKEQMAKWKHPETGLKKDALMIIESLAYDAIKYFGYEAAYVEAPCDVLQFTEAQLEQFDTLNKEGIEEMYEKLKQENIADFNRRVYQAEILSKDVKRVSKRWSIDDAFRAAKKMDTILQKLDESELVEEYTEEGILEGFGTFVCGASSQKGYYPADPMKENQDSFDIRIAIDEQNHFFGVYDGHGTDGTRCSQLCKATIGDIYEEQLSEGRTTKVSLTKAHTDAHDIMKHSDALNAELSGTTSVIACLNGSSLTIAYAGDSAAIIGSKSNRRTPTQLTNPHDLGRPEEVARIERKGGVVMSTEEYDKIKAHMTKKNSSKILARNISNRSFNLHSEHDPQSTDSVGEQAQSFSRMNLSRPNLNNSSHFHQSLSDLMKVKAAPARKSSLQSESVDESDHSMNINQSIRKQINLRASLINSSLDQSYVPRIWSGTSVEKVPGCAFTRSLGDTVAHEIGVSEKPEFKQLAVQDGDVIIIASDGVTEYLDTEEIVEMVNEIDDPAEAARILVKSSAALWAAENDYCDDITAVVIFISGDKVATSGVVERQTEVDHEAKQVSPMVSKSRASKFVRFFQRKKKKQSKKN